MSEHIPAWKRAGLSQQKSKDSYDPVKAGLKRSETGDDTGPKKPPKRVKVPKAERKPPPESDQLAYLRQFHSDRANWKFSKQKQNWILKNIFDIEDKYSEALVEYIASIQGASKQRVIEDCEKLIAEWNEYMTREPEHTAGKTDDTELKTTTESEKSDESSTKPSCDPSANAVSQTGSTSANLVESEDTKPTESAETSEIPESAKAKPKGILKNKQPAEPAQPAPPKEAAAVRAQKIIEAVTGTKPTLEYVE